ncbi:MAG TPA: Ppx/GppA phosphatase family protein [Polyangia bacterium]|nr:Ppx/GppA phosphatase family protein [Polyangia bacterium]
MSRIATIDIGTNTTLLLIAEEREGTIAVLENRAEITRLGRGIGRDGGLGQEGIDRTLAVLSGYAVLARVHEAPIFAIGTEALRRAPNAADFLCRAAALLDTPVEVIDGEREAALTFLAARLSFPEAAAGAMMVVDIGGGSTEVIVARRGAVELCRSLPLGSVRLTERHIHHDPPLAHEIEAVRTEVVGHLAETPFPSDADRPCLVGVAGTVTTLAAMVQDLQSYDPALVHGYRLTLPALDKQIDRLRASTQKEREAMAGLDPARADVILGGAIILSEIARRLGAAKVLVSDRGIRWGLLYEKLGIG